jgi:hypothetical protein
MRRFCELGLAIPSGPGRSELNHVPWYRAIQAITPGLPVIHDLQALAPGLAAEGCRIRRSRRPHARCLGIWSL